MSQANTTTVLTDERVKGFSAMTVTTVGEYLALVEAAYANRGGLNYQREALKTTSAKRIRSRMVQDIRRGAVLPPIVIGAVVSDPDFYKAVPTPDAVIGGFNGAWRESVAIIDGMQRTTALMEAVEDNAAVREMPLRMECWVTKTTDSLIYRMLVLNTGQVPWNLKRQLQVVYAPLVHEIKEHVKLEKLITLEKNERRTKGGEFSADGLVEAYIAFGLRRTDIDTQETLADEFSRLDMAEAISTDKYDKFFYPLLQIMVDLDRAFSKETAVAQGEEESVPAYRGRNIFDRQPARVGFIVALAIAVLGRLGMDRKEEESAAVLEKIQAAAKALIDRLGKMDAEKLSDFLAMDVLNERLSGQKRSAVGRHERAYFETAFKVLIDENFDVPSMEVCWRA